MKTALSALLVASFLIAGPATVFAGDAEKKDAKAATPQKAPDKGATKKEEPKNDSYKLRGR